MLILFGRAIGETIDENKGDERLEQILLADPVYMQMKTSYDRASEEYYKTRTEFRQKESDRRENWAEVWWDEWKLHSEMHKVAEKIKNNADVQNAQIPEGEFIPDELAEVYKFFQSYKNNIHTTVQFTDSAGDKHKFTSWTDGETTFISIEGKDTLKINNNHGSKDYYPIVELIRYAEFTGDTIFIDTLGRAFEEAIEESPREQYVLNASVSLLSQYMSQHGPKKRILARCSRRTTKTHIIRKSYMYKHKRKF